MDGNNLRCKTKILIKMQDWRILWNTLADTMVEHITTDPAKKTELMARIPATSTTNEGEKISMILSTNKTLTHIRTMRFIKP